MQIPNYFLYSTVLDQICTTICQARLLMRSKLKQYIGLVDEAEVRLYIYSICLIRIHVYY